MQKTTSLSRRPRWLVAFLFVVSLLVVTAKKFFDYSAAPAKEKESDFVYPPNADQTKPTTLILQVPTSQQLPFEQVGGFSALLCFNGERQGKDYRTHASEDRATVYRRVLLPAVRDSRAIG